MMRVDAGGRVGAELARDLEAVDARQHEVEDHDRREEPLGPAQRLGAVGRDDGVGAQLAAEGLGQDRSDRVVVLDDHDRPVTPHARSPPPFEDAADAFARQGEFAVGLTTVKRVKVTITSAA